MLVLLPPNPFCLVCLASDPEWVNSWMGSCYTSLILSLGMCSLGKFPKGLWGFLGAYVFFQGRYDSLFCLEMIDLSWSSPECIPRYIVFGKRGYLSWEWWPGCLAEVLEAWISYKNTIKSLFPIIFIILKNFIWLSKRILPFVYDIYESSPKTEYGGVNSPPFFGKRTFELMIFNNKSTS